MLGEILRKSREESGLDLHEVAHTLRIQYEYLRALENGNLEKLPPDVYVKAYIREYARFLNIDAGPLLDEYTALTQKEDEDVQPLPPLAKKKSPLLRIALSVCLVTGVISALVVYISMHDREPVAPISPVTPSVPDHAESVPPGREPQQMTDIPSSPVAPSVRDSLGPAPSKPGPQHMLGVTATETTWLRVETDEGKSEEVLLKPGETKQWSSPDGFKLRVGNAGGVRLVLDDRDIGVPGEKGRVVTLRLPEENR